MLSAAASMMMLSACSSQSADELSAGTVKSEFEKVLEQSGQDEGYVEIPIGYYELNNLDARYQLARLAEAGIIKYSVERYDWWIKILQIHHVGGDAIGHKSFTEEKHIMVNVELTDAGKKLVAERKEITPAEDEDMKQPEINLEDYPENALDTDGYIKKYENWPPIPYPENTDESDLDKDVSTFSKKDDVNQYKKATDLIDEFADNNKNLDKINKMRSDSNYEIIDMDFEASNGYKEAKKKENKETVTLRAFKIKVDKARYIRIFDNGSGAQATAEVIVKYTDVTPVCRAWRGIYNDQKLCTEVSLIYYQDMGWTITGNTFGFSTISTIFAQANALGATEVTEEVVETSEYGDYDGDY